MNTPVPDPIRPESPGLDGYAVLRQRWCDLAYFHWPVDPADVQRLLPEGLGVDTFDDRAWIGLIPFEMRDVQLGPTPAVPYFGTFVEINVRTYVVAADGRRSVWFFSLDVPRAAVVGVARTAFSLPYCWAATTMRSDGDSRRYTFRRRWPRSEPAGADMSYRIGAPIAEPDDLAHFLTARWSLVTQRRGGLHRGAVSHEPWPLHEVHDVAIEQNAIEAAGLPSPVGEPHAMATPGVNVEVAWLRAV